MDDWSALASRNAVSEPARNPQTSMTSRALTSPGPSWMANRRLYQPAGELAERRVRAAAAKPNAVDCTATHASENAAPRSCGNQLVDGELDDRRAGEAERGEDL